MTIHCIQSENLLKFLLREPCSLFSFSVLHLYFGGQIKPLSASRRIRRGRPMTKGDVSHALGDWGGECRLGIGSR